MIVSFPFRLFADQDTFPVHIQYGFHEENDCYPHNHADFSELVVVLDGSAQHVVGGESYRIAKGDVFVINEHTVHSFADASHLRICNIMFKPEQTFADLFDMKKLPGFQALFVLEPHCTQNHHFCSQLRLTAENFSTAETMILEMMELYTQRETGWQDGLFAMFRLLCLRLSQYYQADTVSGGNAFVKLAGAAAYIENNYCSSISTEMLAGIAGYSERQFLRLFKSVFHATPNSYIAGLRIKKAQQLLRTSPLSIGEIAWNCGYDDHNYFSRVFRKHTGMSPVQYREMTENTSP